MQPGLDLNSLRTEISNEATRREDFIVPPKKLRLATHNGLHLEFNNHSYPCNDIAHNQIAAFCGMSARYYDALRFNNPKLLTDNVNYWFETKPRRERLVRTDGQRVRVFLSGQYEIIDHDVFFDAAWPVLEHIEGVETVSAQLTASRLYVELRFPRVAGEPRVGDVVQLGVVLTNSDVGLGPVSIEPFVYRLMCTNGLVMPFAIPGSRLRLVHARHILSRGGVLDPRATPRERRRQLRELVLRSVQLLLRPESFQRLLAAMRQAAESAELMRPEEAVRQVTRIFRLAGREAELVAYNLDRDRDRTRWGLANAITRVANDHPRYDRAVQLQEIGGLVLVMGERRWIDIAA